ncbi:MAG: CASTOR/POLLUX-related putative ion channel [Bacteroidota bacterium]
MKYSYKDRIRYYFENTISAGPVGVIKWLGIVSLAAILFLGLIIIVFGIKADPNADSSIGYIEGVWKSLMATLDPGTMGADEGWAFRLIRFSATLLGIFIISILIGIISSGIDGKLDELRKGKSKVLESDHTLILGWSEKIFSIIEQIIEANTNYKGRAIVILAWIDKVVMEDEIKAKISDFKTSKIIVRRGNPLISSDIEVVNPNLARSIIILSPETENADTFVIKSVMSFTKGKNRKSSPYNIVAEIKEEENLEAAEVAGNGEAVFVHTSDLISRITAQTCRQSGLSVIYSNLIQFEGDEIYFQEQTSLIGKTYKEILRLYDTSSVIGIFSNEEAVINPPMDTVYQPGDQIIAISEDDDTIILNEVENTDIKSHLYSELDVSGSSVEKTLILGWNKNAKTIIAELDEYVAPNSSVVILSESVIDATQFSVTNQTVTSQVGKIISRKILDEIHPENFNHIILLSNSDIDVQESDAQTLICLLHLRNIGFKLNKNLSIVSEMRDLRNREIGLVTRADDFIIGDNIISLMLSQLSENRELKKVFDVLFKSEGSEIYLKPIQRYIKTNVPVDFYTLIERASMMNETAIGYRIHAKKDISEDNFGIKINPKKSNEQTFSAEDFLIVLSES